MTPFVFRRRVPLIGAVFLASALAGQLLRGVAPFAGWTGIVSLPAPLLAGSAGPVPPGMEAALLVPTVLVLLGASLRAWGTSYLRGHVMLDARLHTERLIIAGPYRWMRNPLYVGNLALALGIGWFFPPPGALLCLGLMAAMGFALARAEEQALRAAHGATYDAYARAVPRFLPRPPRGLPAGTPVRPDWRNGLRTEGWGVVFVLYFDLVALQRFPGAAVAAGLLVTFLILRMRHARRARRGVPP